MEAKDRERYVYLKSDKVIIYIMLALAAAVALLLFAGLFQRGVWDQRGNFYSLDSEAAEGVEFCSIDFGEKVFVEVREGLLSVCQGERAESFRVERAVRDGAEYITFTGDRSGVSVGAFAQGRYGLEPAGGVAAEGRPAGESRGAAFEISTAHLKMVRGDVDSKTFGMEGAPFLGLVMMGFGPVMMALKGNVMESNSMGRERREENNRKYRTTKSTLPPKTTQVLYTAMSVVACLLGLAVFAMKFVV